MMGQPAELQDDGDPPYLHPDYVSTRLRAPRLPLLALPDTSDLAAPVYDGPLAPADADLTCRGEARPLGLDQAAGRQVRRPGPGVVPGVELIPVEAGRHRSPPCGYPNPIERPIRSFMISVVPP